MLFVKSFKRLFGKKKTDISDLLEIEPTGLYRRILDIVNEDIASKKADTNKPSIKPIAVPSVAYPKLTVPSSSAITPTDSIPEWFCVPGIQQSPAELLIVEELGKYDIDYYCEVAFHEFKSSDSGHYRYDFFIPSRRLIIEYDSKQYHSDPERIAVDAIKTAWCWNKGIRVHRITNKYYYAIGTAIHEIAKEHKFYKR